MHVSVSQTILFLCDPAGREELTCISVLPMNHLKVGAGLVPLATQVSWVVVPLWKDQV